MPDSTTAAKAKQALGSVMDKLSLKDSKDRSPPPSSPSPTSSSPTKPTIDSTPGSTPFTSDASSPTASSQASSAPSAAAVSLPDHPKQEHHPQNAPPLAPPQEPAGFPTPSSSLFPPPDEGQALSAQLEERIAAAKVGKKKAAIGVDTNAPTTEWPPIKGEEQMSPAEAASSNWRHSVASNASASAGPALSNRPSSRPPSRPPSVHRNVSVGSRASLESTKRASSGSVASIAEGVEKGKAKAAGMTEEARGETNYDLPAPEEAAVAVKLDVVVRDFAFSRTDPRFDGVALPGDDRRGSTMTESSQAEDSPQVGSFGEGGGGSFNWGFVTSHLSSNGHSGSFGEFDEEEEEEDDPHRVPEVFVAGVYQAVYDFEPELETEMRMTTGDVVSVWERQCDGWVQAARMVEAELTGEIGLVPENYLTLLEAASPGPLDQDDADSDWNGEDHQKHPKERSHTPEDEPPVKVQSPAEMTDGEQAQDEVAP